MAARKIRWTVALLCFSSLCFGGLSASADQIHFQVSSLNSAPVRIEFHGVTFSHRWPAQAGTSWRVPDADQVNITLSCSEAEYLCYGAWQENDQTVYWGVGYNNEHRCAKCCYNCDGRTYQINLDDGGE
jgi:hypothetical protein